MIQRLMSTQAIQALSFRTVRFHRDLMIGFRLSLACALVMSAAVASSAQSASTENAQSTENTQTVLPAETGSDAGTAASIQDEPVIVGIMGHYRLGHPTAIRLKGEEKSLGDRLTVETTDGEGVRVTVDANTSFAGSSSAGSGSAGMGEIAYVVPGSEAAALEIKSLGLAGDSVDGDSSAQTIPQTIVSTRFPVAGVPSRGPSLIPPEMPWVVVIGDALGVDQIGVSKLLGRQSRIAVSDVQDAALLPNSLLGYSGVDLIMVNQSGIDVLMNMSSTQRSAVERWLRGGGRLFVCMGKSTDQMAAAMPWLTKHLPIKEWTKSRLDPAALETFVASQTPLDTFEGVKLPRRTGRILLTGRTTRRVTAVLAAEYLVGFGRVSIMAADLDDDEFSTWPERLKLVTQLTGETFAEEDRDGRAIDRGTLFNDLAGQMRGTLDQFRIKSSFSFSLVSLIVMLFAIAIGPIDYLLVNRVLGRPLLGWVTFPLAAIVLSAVLVSQAQPAIDLSEASKASEAGDPSEIAASEPTDPVLMKANQFQVVDLDMVDGVGRGFYWTYVYSHGPGKVDLTVMPGSDVPLSADSSEASPLVVSTASMGYPGQAFGGIQLAGENKTLPPYRVQSTPGDGLSKESRIESIENLTFAPRSSKSIASEVSFSVDPVQSDGITRRPGSELLRGELVNPLEIDILDGMLVYQNWVYLLPTRFRSGDRIPSINELRQKNFRWMLSRRQSLEKSNTKTTPWDPSDFNSISRVAEMLLFHQSAGGELYTGLKHQRLGSLDLSHVLVEDRCLLVGRTERPLLEMQLSDQTALNSSESSFTPAGKTHSMIRVVLPVRATRLN